MSLKVIIDAPNGMAFGEMQPDGTILVTAAEIEPVEIPEDLKSLMVALLQKAESE